MIPIEELSLRVLAELDEAGEENPPSLLNAILLGESDRQLCLASYLQALRSLATQDLVRLSSSRAADDRLAPLSKEQTLVEIGALAQRLVYLDVEAYWSDNMDYRPRYEDLYPYVILTASGTKRSREIIAERGYQWWSPIEP